MAQLTINGNSIYYEVAGDIKSKNVVAFLNGVMASTNSWALLTPTFEKLGFKIILHDFKGQLKSDKPDGPYSFEEHCEEAKKLFEHLEVEKVHLIGTSYGGEVAMKFAVLFPNMVQSISIIDSVSEVDPILEGFVEGWKVLCDTNDGEVFFHAMMPSIYGSNFLKENREMLAERAKAIKNNPNHYLQGQKILYDTFVKDVTMTEELHKITCPALIICGEEDILKPVKFSRILAEKIKDSEFIILPNCGHVAIFEKPKELVSSILGFIMKHPG